MKAIIMAAGYGTRFLPITKTIPKEMLPIVNKPAIQFVIDEFISAGITDIAIISHRKKKVLEDYFDYEPELSDFLAQKKDDALLQMIQPNTRLNVSFIRQPYMNGSGSALLLAESFIGKDPFILAYPDDIVIGDHSLSQQLMDIYQKTQCSVLACEQVPQEELSRYGVIRPGSYLESSVIEVKEIIEKPDINQAPSNIITIGRYLLTADIFPLLKKCYENFHQKGEFFLTLALQELALQNKLVGYIHHEQRLDIGEPRAYVRSLLMYLKQLPEYKDIFDELVES